MVRKSRSARASGNSRADMEGPPAYSTLEVAKHSRPEDAWIIVGGKVLNISAWLDEHPGGDVVLLDLAGRDATREFEDVGHSSDARSKLEGLVIGSVRPATDEELRISRGAEGSGSKLISVSSSREAAFAWAQDNAMTIKRIGALGMASAAVLTLAVIAHRYGSGGRQ